VSAMFIIRMKNHSPGRADWVVMKTPIGNLCVAFIDERDAQQYVAATGAEAFCEPVPHETVLRRDSNALEGIKTMLLLPSLEVVRWLLRDAGTFPYENYLVDVPSVADEGETGW
jgi:hypothetical protein